MYEWNGPILLLQKWPSLKYQLYSSHIFFFERINSKITCQQAEENKNNFCVHLTSVYKSRMCKQQDINCSLIGQINFTVFACSDVIYI